MTLFILRHLLSKTYIHKSLYKICIYLINDEISAKDCTMSRHKFQITISDIAKALNVTPSTVSRALNDHPKISQRTKIAVRKMADKLDYRQNHLASALRSGKSNILGFIVPTADRHFFSSIVTSFEEVARQANYTVMICQSHDSHLLEVQNIEALMRTRVDAIILSVARETQSTHHFKSVIDKGIPLIMYDRVVDDLAINSVLIDDFQGAYQATSHLIQQGCRRIAHYAGPQHVMIYSERLRGYQAALKDYGFPYDSHLVLESDLELKDGVKLASVLLAFDPLPDGLFAASDYAALGSMQVFKKQSIGVPSEIAVVGFLNEPFSAFIDPALSTVDQRKEEMGRLVAKVTLDQIHHQNEPIISHKTILKPSLIIRQSSLRKP